MTEDEFKQQQRKEKAMCSRFKRRYRKDLSVDELEKIVAATKQPFRLHKDIAQEFMITARLVGVISSEAEKKPKKLDLKR